MGFQPGEAEAFVVPRLFVVGRKHHLQPVAEKRLHGVAQEVGEAVQRQGQRGVGHIGRRCALLHRGGHVGTVFGAVGGTPFAGVGEQARGVFATGAGKVAAAEGLQRVFGGAVVHRGLAPHGSQVVAQLRHQHRGRLCAVVAHAAPAPADVQHLAGRQQGFEHELAVVPAARAVAGALLAGQAHQVKVAAGGGAGVVAVVHAQQAHHLKGHGAQGHEGAKRHAPGLEAALQRGGLQGVEPRLGGHLPGHGLVEPGQLTRGQPGRQRVGQGREGEALGVVGGFEKPGQQGLSAHAPFGGGGGRSGLLVPVREGIEHVGQAAHHGGVKPGHLGIRRHGIGGWHGGVAQQVALQQALQAKPGGVLGAAGVQPQAAAVVGVEPPAHTGTGHPVQQGGQLVFGHAETGGHGGHGQQVGQLAVGGALARQAEQPVGGGHQGAVVAGIEVGNVERDVARVMSWVLPEHGADGGGHGVDARHHHHDLARAQARQPLRATQQGQQLVVQHLQLAHGAVGGVEHDRAVGGGGRRGGGLGGGHQVADVVLHLLQPGAFGGRAVVKQVDARQCKPLAGGLGVVKRVELANEIAALLAPGTQQRVAVGVHVVQRHLGQRHAVFQGQAVALGLQQLAPGQGVGPVEAAGVGHGQQHLGVGGQRRQQGQRAAGQLRHAKHHHPARHGQAAGLGLGQCRQHALVQLGAGGLPLLGRQTGQQRAPQHRLPRRARRQSQRGTVGIGQVVKAAGPRIEPVGPVHLVLVEQVGQVGGQLQQAVGPGLAQVVGHGGQGGLVQHGGQVLHQPPGEGQFVQRGVGGHGVCPQHLAVGAPQKAGGQLHTGGGGHAHGGGQLHLQPLGHAVALHQQGFGLQRVKRVALQPGHHGLGQGFGAVAVQGNEPGGDVRKSHATSLTAHTRPACQAQRRQSPA